MALWKNSTTVILAARYGANTSYKLGTDSFDYKILSLKRHQKSSFMPGAYVFPGGVTDSADSSLKWKSLYTSFGINDENYQIVYPKVKSRPDIFKASSNELPREISLRITAIRETFEECGILLCKQKFNKDKVRLAKNLPLSENDVKLWQNKVQTNAEDFYEMCKKFECYPDLWALHEWNNWLTGVYIGKKRFDAVFFLAGIENIPQTNYSVTEIQDLRWETAADLIENFEPYLLPPQFYELSRIVQFHTLDSLVDFAAKRSGNGIHLYLPVKSTLADGYVVLLPGDSKYPENVSKTEIKMLDNSDMTILQYRQSSKILNRIEIYTKQNKKYVVSNHKCDDGHLTPKSNII